WHDLSSSLRHVVSKHGGGIGGRYASHTLVRVFRKPVPCGRFAGGADQTPRQAHRPMSFDGTPSILLLAAIPTHKEQGNLLIALRPSPSGKPLTDCLTDYRLLSCQHHYLGLYPASTGATRSLSRSKRWESVHCRSCPAVRSTSPASCASCSPRAAGVWRTGSWTITPPWSGLGGWPKPLRLCWSQHCTRARTSLNGSRRTGCITCRSLALESGSFRPGGSRFLKGQAVLVGKPVP